MNISKAKATKAFMSEQSDLVQRAEQGEDAALQELVARYRESPGYTEKTEFALYKKAAKKGAVSAQLWLSQCPRCGKGQQFKWCKRAAKQGNVVAILKMGHHYRDRQDSYKAFVWYLKAANAGNAVGQYYVGWRYKHGGVKVKYDWDESCRWLILSAMQGYEEAIVFLMDNLCLYREYLATHVDKEILTEWKAIATVKREDRPVDVSWYIKSRQEHEDYKRRLHAWATGTDGSDVPHYDVSDM